MHSFIFPTKSWIRISFYTSWRRWLNLCILTMEASHFTIIAKKRLVECIPLCQIQCNPLFSLDTHDLPLQLWSNDGGESIFDHHTPWQLRWGRFLHCVSLESTYFWCYWYLFVTECSFSVCTLTSPTHFPGFTVPNQSIACWPISRMMTNQSTVSLILWSNFSCGKPQMTYQRLIAQSTCYILSYLNFVHINNTDGSAHTALQMTLISHPMCSYLSWDLGDLYMPWNLSLFGAKIRAMKYP